MPGSDIRAELRSCFAVAFFPNFIRSLRSIGGEQTWTAGFDSRCLQRPPWGHSYVCTMASSPHLLLLQGVQQISGQNINKTEKASNLK